MRVYPPIFYLLAEPSVTDWIQAVAALGAVIFGAFTVVDILRRGKENERNITLLSDSLRQYETMANEAKTQTYLMRESNEAQIRLVETLIKDVNAGIQESQEAAAQKKQLRKKQILPYFIHVSTRTEGLKGGLELTMRNEGEAAKNIHVVTAHKSHIEFPEYKVKKVPKNGEIAIRGQSTGETSMNAARYSVSIYFEDQDGNKYRQTLAKGDGYEVTDPAPV